MKRAVLAIKNTLILEVVTKALEYIGFFVQKSFSQDEDKISTLVKTLSANVLIMDVTRWEDGTFDSRMSVASSVKQQNPEIKVALLCDSVSDEDIAYRIKCAKKEGRIDAFFYESVPSDYLADVIDSL